MTSIDWFFSAAYFSVLLGLLYLQGELGARPPCESSEHEILQAEGQEHSRLPQSF